MNTLAKRTYNFLVKHGYDFDELYYDDHNYTWEERRMNEASLIDYWCSLNAKYVEFEKWLLEK